MRVAGRVLAAGLVRIGVADPGLGPDLMGAPRAAEPGLGRALAVLRWAALGPPARRRAVRACGAAGRTARRRPARVRRTRSAGVAACEVRAGRRRRARRTPAVVSVPTGVGRAPGIDPGVEAGPGVTPDAALRSVAGCGPDGSPARVAQRGFPVARLRSIHRSRRGSPPTALIGLRPIRFARCRTDCPRSWRFTWPPRLRSLPTIRSARSPTLVQRPDALRGSPSFGKRWVSPPTRPVTMGRRRVS